MSVHVGAAHALPVHTPLWQSVPPVQPLLVGHLGQDPPPQSVSVSVPFLTPSPQVGVWQTLPVHTPLAQSLSPEHAFPLPHFFAGAHDPPQSVSVSVPFLTPSPQLGAWH